MVLVLLYRMCVSSVLQTKRFDDNSISYRYFACVGRQLSTLGNNASLRLMNKYLVHVSVRYVYSCARPTYNIVYNQH